MPQAYPVIFVPGVQASSLRDEYPVQPETVWELSLKYFLLKDSERIIPHPYTGGPKEGGSFARYYELKGPSRVRPNHLFVKAYGEAIENLRHQLSDKPNTNPVPVFPFAYDWRQPLEFAIQDLDDFIQEVIERTLLLKHYRGSDNDFYQQPKVDIVCHSMGGLIAAGLLNSPSALNQNKIRNLITLGTPFRGSYESVLALTTGRAMLDMGAIQAREATAARLTPALYYMLPSLQPVIYKGVNYSGKQVAFKFFEPDYWQRNIIDGIADSIKSVGFDVQLKAEDVFHGMLSRAREFRESLEEATLGEARGLCIVGLGEDTRFNLKIDVENGQPKLDLRSEERRSNWKYPSNKDTEDTGDGTVPFQGALSNLFRREEIVCVEKDDFRYFEDFTDTAFAKVAGLHGALPAMDLLHRLIVRFILDIEDKYGGTKGKPAPGVGMQDWKPPFSPILRAE